MSPLAEKIRNLMERFERPNARPVGDLPVDDLRDGADVAKRWLLELIASAPLASAQTLPTADFVRGGPSLCAALIEALGSDTALEVLEHSPSAADAGRLTGASDAVATVVAVEALRVALLSSLRARLSEPSGDLVAAVSDRVSAVIAVVLTRSLGTAATTESPAAPAQWSPEEEQPTPVVPEPDVPITVSKPPAPDPWLVAIERWINQVEHGESFAVLTAEIDDVDRLVASASGKEVAVAIETAERSLIGALAPSDILIRERIGRYWVLSPTSDATIARDLGEQLAASVSDAAVVAGAPLTASVGLAMYPASADTADELAARADEALFAARSAGIRIA